VADDGQTKKRVAPVILPKNSHYDAAQWAELIRPQRWTGA